MQKAGKGIKKNRTYMFYIENIVYFPISFTPKTFFMRNNTILRLLYVSLFLAIVVISCKKNDIKRFESPLTEKVDDYKFLNKRLKEFAKEFTPVLSDKNARNLIVKKAKEKFDDEYEVLVNDLFNERLITSLVPYQVNISLHRDLYKRSGEFLYPQIYIPRFQYIEDNYISNRIETDTTEEIVYVFYSGNAEVDSAQSEEVYPGYRLVEGNYVYYTMVDENYANEHEVWIFSLNESPEFNRNTIPCIIDPCAPQCIEIIDPENGCGGGGGGGGGTENPDDDPTDAPAARNDFPDLGHQKTNFKIHQMRVRGYRESWLAGASEISIKAKLTCHNGRDLGVINGQQKEYSSDQYANKLGKLIKKVKRKDIRNLELLTLNYPLQTNWQNQDPNQDPIYFIYTIFERDIFPATEHRDNRYCPVSLISNEPPPGSFTLYWRSQDKRGQGAPYAQYFFTNTTLVAPTSNEYAGSGLVENGSIAFNTVIY